MKIKQLANNQFYFNDDTKIVFQSYDTIVCKITKNEGCEPIVEITEGQPQSKTTAKWLNEFLRITVGINNYKELKK